MYQKKHKSQTELAAAFYETYKKRIYQIARYLSTDEDACSELVQETLCALLDHLDLLESLHPEQIEVYIERTMHNIKINAYRRSKKLSFVSFEEMDSQNLSGNLDEQMENMMTHLEVLHLMEKLSLEDRLLLRGKYIEGQSAQELAEMLGCKPDSIRMKMLRARRRAFHILQER